MIYLASPYAHLDPAIMQQRYDVMVHVVNTFYKRSIAVYSPIVHNHPIALAGGLPRTWDFWRKIDMPMLRVCKELTIVKLDGWQQSVGVKAETEFAINLGLPISYITLEDLGL